MFGIKYLKASPTQYIIQYRNGKRRRSGAGMAFLYYHLTNTISIVPIGSVDVPFIFNEITKDYQAITVQGQLTYRIIDPEKVAGLLDYSIDSASGAYVSDDPTKLSQRLVNRIQAETRTEIQSMQMQQAIHASEKIASTVLERLLGSQALEALGVELLGLAILGVKPTPEIVRAMEADAREQLLRKADDAIYERRNSAVEQERRIQENELNTEIAIENEKKNLLSARTENLRTEADAQAYALAASLEQLKQMSPEVLTLLGLQSAEPRLLMAKAIQEIAQNAEKIGHLSITPDLLESIMGREMSSGKTGK